LLEESQSESTEEALMPLRSDWTSENCPIARSLEVLGDPWVLLVLRQAFSGVRRFDQFRDQLGVADNVLSKRLATLVDAGLLRRVAYQDRRRTRSEYVLTDAGADTLPVITALAQWGERHRPHADPDVRMDIIDRTCGCRSTTADFCSDCGARLTVDTTLWRKTWRTPQDMALTGPAA
jgi:DNA-binding HxlR family transcriptional regulator